MSLREVGSFSESGDARRIEEQIWGLGESIHPNRMHKDRLLEDARDAAVATRRRKRSAKTLISMSLVIIACAPLVGTVLQFDLPKPPTSVEVNEATLRHVESHRTSYDWALVEVFRDFSLGRLW